jgi:hypothetical protein
MSQATVGSYRTMFIAFMNFIHEQEYDRDHAFPVAVLGEITPKQCHPFFQI